MTVDMCEWNCNDWELTLWWSYEMILMMSCKFKTMEITGIESSATEGNHIVKGTGRCTSPHLSFWNLIILSYCKYFVYWMRFNGWKRKKIKRRNWQSDGLSYLLVSMRGYQIIDKSDELPHLLVIVRDYRIIGSQMDC
jgi:hypothetical protein